MCGPENSEQEALLCFLKITTGGMVFIGYIYILIMCFKAKMFLYLICFRARLLMAL